MGRWFGIKRFRFRLVWTPTDKKNHRSNIMKKMEAHNMVDMMNYVRENAVIVL